MPSYNQIVLHMPVARRITQCGYGGVGLVLFSNCESILISRARRFLVKLSRVALGTRMLRRKLHPATSTRITTPCSPDKLDLNLPRDADKYLGSCRLPVGKDFSAGPYSNGLLYRHELLLLLLLLLLVHNFISYFL